MRVGGALQNLLAWFRGDENAAQNGLLLWDEANGYPIVSKNGAWVPLILNDNTAFVEGNTVDFGVTLAEAEILSTYGDTVSTLSTAKTLLKFGKRDDLGTSKSTVWQTDGNETYVTTNTINTISSSNTGDIMVVTIEGHTISGSGTGTQFTAVTQTATLDGQNKVTLSTALARVSSVYASGTDSPAGDIYVYEDGTITAGVPDDISTAHIVVKGTNGETKSFKAATTFSNSEYFICTGGFCSVDKKTSATVDFELQVRTAGGLFNPVARLALDSSAQTSQQIKFYPYQIVPKNSDIRVVAVSSAAGTEVSVQFYGFISEVTA